MMIPLPLMARHILIELGPRATGKSFAYREIAPYVILLSGRQDGIPNLFGWKNRKDKPCLVMKFNPVTFDEVAGSHFKTVSGKQLYKGYMEQGSFSGGDDKGNLSVEAGDVWCI